MELDPDPYFLIVGAGLYGCHAALMLKKMGIKFKIADKSNDVLTGSSSKNQNLLHLGFHYCRSYNTRHECIEGYDKFRKAYPNAAKPVKNNYYLLHRDSLLDYQTYKHIYTHENISFYEDPHANIPFKYNKSMFQGTPLLTNEMFVDPNELKKQFKSELNDYLIPKYDPNRLIIRNEENEDSYISYNGETFTNLIDCTYFQLKIPGNLYKPDIFYELCIAFIYEYKSEETIGFTVMDGPFFSIYPYNIEKHLYSLTDVEKTPIIKTKKIKEIYDKLEYYNDNLDEVIKLRDIFESRVLEYIPSFKINFKLKDYYLSIKTKPNLKTDDRSLIHVKISNNIDSFCGGKLTGIFAMEEILKLVAIGR